jgi:tripartite-type tricarboxylate transporter receptor subunit TctC
MRTQILRLFATGLAVLLMTLGALSANSNWPERPITFIVPYSAGGGTDIVARLVAAEVSEALGQPVVVENRTGANGMVGTEAVTTAAPDGYTFLVTTAAVAINPSIEPDVRYDPLKDLQPVARLVSLPFVLVSNPQVPAESLREAVDYLKDKGKAVNFATGGTTTTLAGEVLKLAAGVDFTFVLYRGSAPAIMSVVSGETEFYISDLPSAAAQASSGAVRPIVVTGPERTASMPDVPTSTEAGFPEFVVTSWFAAFGPAGTPRDIV